VLEAVTGKGRLTEPADLYTVPVVIAVRCDSTYKRECVGFVCGVGPQEDVVIVRIFLPAGIDGRGIRTGEQALYSGYGRVSYGQSSGRRQPVTRYHIILTRGFYLQYFVLLPLWRIIITFNFLE